MGDISAANLIGGILFGGIGFVAFVYGMKLSNLKPMLLGLALMIFPYFVPNTMLMYGVGIALTAALFFLRD